MREAAFASQSQSQLLWWDHPPQFTHMFIHNGGVLVTPKRQCSLLWCSMTLASIHARQIWCCRPKPEHACIQREPAFLQSWRTCWIGTCSGCGAVAAGAAHPEPGGASAGRDSPHGLPRPQRASDVLLSRVLPWSTVCCRGSPMSGSQSCESLALILQSHHDQDGNIDFVKTCIIVQIRPRGAAWAACADSQHCA